MAIPEESEPILSPSDVRLLVNRNTPSSDPTESMRFDVEGLGVVGIRNSAWLHLQTPFKREHMEINESRECVFVTGAGKTTSRVTRVA